VKLASAFAKRLARILADKKAEEVKIINVKGLSAVTEFFVFASAGSTVHNRALAEEVRLKGREEWKLHHMEGVEGGDWILIDFVEVIVHLFITETREFYGLEQLWGDGKEVKWT
jgi:ribosome-associated protein